MYPASVKSTWVWFGRPRTRLKLAKMDLAVVVEPLYWLLKEGWKFEWDAEHIEMVGNSGLRNGGYESD